MMLISWIWLDIAPAQLQLKPLEITQFMIYYNLQWAVIDKYKSYSLLMRQYLNYQSPRENPTPQIKQNNNLCNRDPSQTKTINTNQNLQILLQKIQILTQQNTQLQDVITLQRKTSDAQIALLKQQLENYKKQQQEIETCVDRLEQKIIKSCTVAEQKIQSLQQHHQSQTISMTTKHQSEIQKLTSTFGVKQSEWEAKLSQNIKNSQQNLRKIEGLQNEISLLKTSINQLSERNKKLLLQNSSVQKGNKVLLNTQHKISEQKQGHSDRNQQLEQRDSVFQNQKRNQERQQIKQFQSKISNIQSQQELSIRNKGIESDHLKNSNLSKLYQSRIKILQTQVYDQTNQIWDLLAGIDRLENKLKQAHLQITTLENQKNQKNQKKLLKN